MGRASLVAKPGFDAVKHFKDARMAKPLCQNCVEPMRSETRRVLQAYLEGEVPSVSYAALNAYFRENVEGYKGAGDSLRKHVRNHEPDLYQKVLEKSGRG